MLINSLLSQVNDARWDEFIFELEQLNVRKAVVVSQIQVHIHRLTEGCTSVSCHPTLPTI